MEPLKLFWVTGGERWAEGAMLVVAYDGKQAVRLADECSVESIHYTFAQVLDDITPNQTVAHVVRRCEVGK